MNSSNLNRLIRNSLVPTGAKMTLEEGARWLDMVLVCLALNSIISNRVDFCKCLMTFFVAVLFEI